MTKLLWLLKWILKAAIFFTLFAFALNNQHDLVLHFFFGHQWNAPVVLIVLAVFTLGLVMGFLAMGWTVRHRRKSPAAPASPASTPSKSLPPVDGI